MNDGWKVTGHLKRVSESKIEDLHMSVDVMKD
jgi:hypothetical protein